MKRPLSIFLIIFIVLSFAACGSISNATDGLAPGNGIVIENYTLVDNAKCTVTIISVDPDDNYGYTMNVLLENHSRADLLFVVDDVAINGYMCDPSWASLVFAGSKESTQIRWDRDSLEKNSISIVRFIEFLLRVYNDGDSVTGGIVEEAFILYPMGDAVNTVLPDARAPVQSDIVLLDNKYCTVIVTGFEPNHPNGYTMNVYIINRSDFRVMFSIDDVRINGFKADPDWVVSVTAGNQMITGITWDKSSFEKNDIDSVEEIEFFLNVYSYESWETDRLISRMFTINP